ncbi:alpha/beta hydrolase [Roseateles koreensis]|uniref:Alpha/beta hydrolase n=1 Tax=Roseateles koreensis TaxID=2987526 RepID=A0ABT5KUD1_9BURK|nr:alpha/beta hydrolase [Roseateles koreensis]MDC8786555.1 alpha/beta hydrolase [Roseateles koreensis]
MHAPGSRSIRKDNSRRQRRGAVSLSLAALSCTAASAGTSPAHPCRVEGIPTELLCGALQRPLDPSRPQGTQIDIHYLVVPALARNKQPEPVLMLAGGPGQSALAVAPAVLPALSRLNNRRDLVFIDQRGTGQSAPLQCADDSALPLAQALDLQATQQRIDQCRIDLEMLPHGNLRMYTTTLAMQDFDAVREALGAPRWNLIGGSYGTRAALEYLRLFPGKVRRTVIDGVAPPDMVLPASLSTDAQSAWDATLRFCDTDPQCQRQFPQLRQDWRRLLQSLPQSITVNHPLTGKPETLTLTRDQLLRTVRVPLYAPVLSAALPAAMHAASEGHFEGLLGLSSVMASSKGSKLAEGMHFSVVCAEDMPRLSDAATAQALQNVPGADFGQGDAQFYQQACKNWPRGAVPPAFYNVAASASPVLLLSGGADPVTPPRHAARVAKALGARAQHIVVPEAGHGVMALGCMREVIYRFIDTPDDSTALPQDASCASKIPHPTVFVPVQAGPQNKRAP